MNSQENSTTAPGGATVLRNLIDVADFLGEARLINEAAYMAAEALPPGRRDPLRQVLNMGGDSLRLAIDKLDAVLTALREGGAA